MAEYDTVDQRTKKAHKRQQQTIFPWKVMEHRFVFLKMLTRLENISEEPLRRINDAKRCISLVRKVVKTVRPTSHPVRPTASQLDAGETSRMIFVKLFDLMNTKQTPLVVFSCKKEVSHCSCIDSEEMITCTFPGSYTSLAPTNESTAGERWQNFS